MRVTNGVASEVLDVNVDSGSEHGLLGIALHPNFASNNLVYLYYTESNGLNDSGGAAGNRVYKYLWNGTASTLTLAQVSPILDLPVTPGPNHNGGIITFGPDGKLYVINGDLNRNGQLQNFPTGPVPDDTSVIHRLNDDGSIPTDNPFFSSIDPTNPIGKYYAYGIRNSFGMAFDAVTGKLWDTENGENTYDEINLVEPGFNSGWESIMGPASRPENAGHSVFVIPGSQYADPKFSWFVTVGPTAIAFLNSTELGAQYENDVFVGDINNGNLYHFVPNANRNGFVLSGALSDLVADNNTSELNPVIFGTGFDGITDLKVGPDGFLYVVSFGDGAIYRISPASPALVIGATLLPDAEVGVLYDVDLQISGGTEPYNITPIAGSLPGGILPNSTGLTGAPNTAKKFKFTLQVTDAGTGSVSRQFRINVLKALVISTQSLKNGRVGKNYKATLKATGGKAPYTWSRASGALPSWAQLSLSGLITGTPLAPESQNFTLQVIDALGGTDQQSLTLTAN
jgi:glucose/arabinose dehydrogenase